MTRPTTSISRKQTGFRFGPASLDRGELYALTSTAPRTVTTITVTLDPLEGMRLALRLGWRSLRAAVLRRDIAFYTEHEEAE